MNATKLKALEPIILEELARRSLAEFCQRMDPGYIAARHCLKLIEHLEALERREIEKLAVFMPPRHSKTYHTSQRFPAWYLGRNPKNQIILVSHSAELAEANSRVFRTLVGDDRWPFPGVRVSEDSSAVNRWDTNQGGKVIAAGIGSGLTGFGAHLLAIDDPIRDPAVAYSEAMRDSIWQWYQEVARTRLMPRAVQLITQTRWHESDLAGRLLDSPGGKEWTVLSLPAIAEENDPLGRVVGEVLWPEWMPADKLPSVAKGEISSRAYAAQFQQNPVPAAGELFKLAWMGRRYNPESSRFQYVIQAIDSAWKTGPSNDRSCIATWGTDGVNYFLLDVWCGRVEYPDLKRQVVDQYNRHRPMAIIVEEAASGLGIVQELKTTTKLPIIGAQVRGSKEARAETITPYFEAGKVLLPAGKPWLEDWINEHLRFPAGKHDDQVDTTSLALARLSVYSNSRPAMAWSHGAGINMMYRTGTNNIFR